MTCFEITLQRDELKFPSRLIQVNNTNKYNGILLRNNALVSYVYWRKVIRTKQRDDYFHVQDSKLWCSPYRDMVLTFSKIIKIWMLPKTIKKVSAGKSMNDNWILLLKLWYLHHVIWIIMFKYGNSTLLLPRWQKSNWQVLDWNSTKHWNIKLTLNVNKLSKHEIWTQINTRLYLQISLSNQHRSVDALWVTENAVSS